MILHSLKLKYSKGFTLIELAVIIIILSIISAVAIVRFIDLHKKTEDLRENLVIGAIRTSVLFNYTKTNSWPEVNPLSLIDSPPSYVEGCPPLDAKTWAVFQSEDGFWRIFSPQSTYCLGEPSGPGKEWRYFYQGSGTGQLLKVYDGKNP